MTDVVRMADDRAKRSQWGSTLALKGIKDFMNKDHSEGWEWKAFNYCRPMPGYVCFVAHNGADQRFRQYLATGKLP